MMQALELVLVHHAIEFHALQQANGSDGESKGLLDAPFTKKGDFQAAAAKIHNHSRLQWTKRSAHSPQNETRFLSGVNCLQPNAGAKEDAVQ
jgi:hypothetical protein